MSHKWTHTLHLAATDLVATIRDETGAIVCQCEGAKAEEHAKLITALVNVHATYQAIDAHLREAAGDSFTPFVVEGGR